MAAAPKPPNAPQPSSIRVALNLPFSSIEVAEYVFRPDVLAYWLGNESKLSPELGSEALLPTAVPREDSEEGPSQSSITQGKVTSLVWPGPATGTDGGRKPTGELFELVVTLNADRSTCSVTFRLTPRQVGQTSRLRIECSGLRNKAERRASLKLWQSALNGIALLMTQANKACRRERQAVIVVHGVGEQRPGQFLRQFVENVFKQGAGEVHFVKPDYVSPLFEMRMATVPRIDATRPTTDVYELYWAHLIRDTTVAQVYGWVFRLLASPGHKIPRTLTRVVWSLRALIFAVVLALAWWAIPDQGVSSSLKNLGFGLAALSALAPALLKFFQNQFVVGYAGDAARYLAPRPENIAKRQDIREAGTQLLDALHDKGRYSRIVVYGHSLGSVIAYDILSRTWAQKFRDRDQGAPSITTSRALRALENLLNRRDEKAEPVTAEIAQPMQHAAWLESRRNGFKWLVSDFVTAGSPLTHARWLLDLDAKTQFTDLVRDRSFPTCPPQTESVASPVPHLRRQVFTFTHAYVDESNAGAKRSAQVPHHAGLFALTRWTNLYFPYSGLIKGDPIGGPLAEQFGDWVRDVQLNTAKGFAHSRYTNRDLDREAVLQVRAALNLPFQRPLADLASAGLKRLVVD